MPCRVGNIICRPGLFKNVVFKEVLGNGLANRLCTCIGLKARNQSQFIGGLRLGAVDIDVSITRDHSQTSPVGLFDERERKYNR